jgi:hypothetical protein
MMRTRAFVKLSGSEATAFLNDQLKKGKGVCMDALGSLNIIPVTGIHCYQCKGNFNSFPSTTGIESVRFLFTLAV